MESISEKAGAGPDFRKAKRRRKPQGDVLAERANRQPPHSIEAEQGVLGCILLAPHECLKQTQAKFGATAPFFDLRHDAIYNAMVRLGKNLEFIALQQLLKDNGELDHIGGIAYLNQIQDTVPSAANLDYYLTAVVERYELRRMIQTCIGIVDRAYSFDGDYDQLRDEVEFDLSNLIKRKPSTSGSILGWDEMQAMDTTADLNCILGFNNNKTTRYLCKGHAAWLIGPSGVGKSSLLFQMGTCFATGKDFHGITPAYGRAMRILIVQAENDSGDMAEMAKGIHSGLNMDDAFDDAAVNLARENIKVVSVSGKIGIQFCAWLRHEIESFRADIVLVDPLLSFAGIDVGRQDQVSQFCRIWLGPVLQETGVVMIAAHHTGKPPREQGKGKPAAQSLTDLAYAGIGSSELVNWARAVMLLQTAGENLYRLVLAKRGKRAGAKHPNGDWTTSIYLRHADDKIFWEQVEPPAETEKSKGASGGPKPKLEGLALGVVWDKITTATSLTNIAKLIQSFALKQGENVGLTTCKNHVATMIKNNVLKEVDGGFIKS